MPVACKKRMGWRVVPLLPARKERLTCTNTRTSSPASSAELAARLNTGQSQPACSTCLMHLSRIPKDAYLFQCTCLPKKHLLNFRHRLNLTVRHAAPAGQCRQEKTKMAVIIDGTFKLNSNDTTPVHDNWTHNNTGYNADCSCCFLGFSHTDAVHAKEAANKQFSKPLPHQYAFD